MKKLCNILLILISLAILVVLILIVIKYTQNYKNEQEIVEVIANLDQTELQEEQEEIIAEYDGYKIIGTIKISKIELEYPILEETTEQTMRKSVTYFWGNGVNEIGNLCIAGHNNYDGTMFGKIKNLEIGDTIELTNMKKITKQYEIYDIFKTNPDDISILEVQEAGTREVTLITCTNGNKERLIVKAREI